MPGEPAAEAWPKVVQTRGVPLHLYTDDLDAKTRRQLTNLAESLALTFANHANGVSHLSRCALTPSPSFTLSLWLRSSSSMALS